MDRIADKITNDLPAALFRYRLSPDGADSFPWVNVSFAWMCGIEPELLAHAAAPLWEQVNPDDRKKLAVSFNESAQSLKPLSTKFRLRGLWEGERWLELSAMPEQVEPEGTFEWRGFLTAETLPPRGDRDGGDRDSLPRLMMEHCRDGLMVLDMDGRVREVNGSMSRMLGYSRDELCQMHLWDFEAQGSRDELMGRIRAMDFDDFVFETLFRRKDGVCIDVEVCPAVVDWCGERLLFENVRDISVRKQSDAASRDHVYFLQQLLDAIPIAVFYKDLAGKYLGCNTAFEVLFALPREQIIGKTVFDVAPADLADLYHAADAQLLREPGVQVYESAVPHRDGTMHDVIFNKATYSDSNGNVSGIVGAIIDITERKDLEAQLNHAQKMEAVGQLAGGVAHDFNNILTAVIGFANLIEMNVGIDSPLASYLKYITFAAEKGASLTQNLLYFSRKRELDLRRVDLDEVITNARPLMTRIIREDISLSISRAERPLTVLADDSQLTHVLLNLTANARDAMSQGGCITIATSLFVMDQDFVERNGHGKPGRYALIAFSDNGCGIDEKTRERIFEPYFTTKGVGKGTGLGLATVYGIIKQLEGFINVHSELGAGTVFRIYLPELNELTAVDESGRRGTPAHGGNETVLLAEDDTSVLGLKELLLVEAGYTVITAGDGMEATKKFREKASSIDLLVIDAVMPRKNGLDVVRDALDIIADIPAIVMSGYSSEIMDLNGFINKGVKFLQKPVNPCTFLATVREVLDGRARNLACQVKR